MELKFDTSPDLIEEGEMVKIIGTHPLEGTTGIVIRHCPVGDPYPFSGAEILIDGEVHKVWHKYITPL